MPKMQRGAAVIAGQSAEVQTVRLTEWFKAAVVGQHSLCWLCIFVVRRTADTVSLCCSLGANSTARLPLRGADDEANGRADVCGAEC